MRLSLVFVWLAGAVLAQEPEFPLTEDSKVQEGVAKGTMVKGEYVAREGSVFPGTVREYQLYLPAGFDKAKPAAFMVFQDGVIYQAPVVFDNLIAKGDMPPMVGVFIKPGVVPAANENALPRFNRSFEYDSVTPLYSRVLIEEFLPAVEREHGIAFSTNPNEAAITGNSSGGICAFMVAWHRPDRFRRVFTGVGTYVGIHGADQLPVWVRKFEPKPIRVFLQSGTGDNNLYCGDWWMANQMMERSLSWAGYEVNHVWGEGGHNQKHASQVFPEAMRWLWREWKTEMEVKANVKGESKWKGYEVVGEGEWEFVLRREPSTNAELKFLTSSIDGTVWSALATADQFEYGHEHQIQSGEHVNWKLTGLVSCHERSPGGLVRIPVGGSASVLRQMSGDEAVFGMCINRSGELLASAGGSRQEEGLLMLDDEGLWRRLAVKPEIEGASLCISHSGILFAGGGIGSEGAIRAYRLPSAETVTPHLETVILPGLARIALSPDQTQIVATSGKSRHVVSGQLMDNGRVVSWQPFSELQPNEDGMIDARGLCFDANGWLYTATKMGIQVCDQAGRVNFIIPTPKQPLDVCFGGKDLGELFIACGDTVYKRATKAKGVVSGQMAPIKPAPPKL